MPGFIKTPQDEKRWAKAKEGVMKARKKTQEQMTDRDWALTNSIYQKMKGKKKE